MATFEEVFEQFKHLSPADQGRLMDAARQHVRWNNANLRAGAQVCFRHSKTGATIEGTFVRMKQKYAEVESLQDKHGLRRERPGIWNVPPEMLRPVSMPRTRP